MVYMYSIRIRVNPSGYYMSENPEPFEPFKHSKLSIHSVFVRTLRTIQTKLNTSNQSGFPISLKKLILTRCNAWRGKRIEPI